MKDDLLPLRRFVDDGAEDAFAAIVRRHLSLVFSVALRRVGGDAQLAEETAQMVFIEVARRGYRLLTCRALAAWLYTATQYTAAKVVRAERRRRKHEQEAGTMQEFDGESAHDAEWASIRPVIDDAMLRLKPRERDAVVLRFFDGRGFAEIGEALGLTESGARMRVERALEKLRAELHRRGIRSTMAALGAVLAGPAVAAPPAGLAASIATAASSSATVGSGAFTLVSFFAMTKTQIGITAGVVLAGAVTIGVQRHQHARLQAEIAMVPQEHAETGRLQTEIARLEQAADDAQSLGVASAEFNRLQGEAKQLGVRLRELKSAAAARQSVRDVILQEGAVYEVAELDLPPRMVEHGFPKYPPDLRAAGIPGEVDLLILIDENGSVVAAEALDSTHPGFSAAAIAKLKQWKFRPGERDGQPVRTFMEMHLTFPGGATNSWF